MAPDKEILFHSTAEIIEAIKLGEMVVIVDDEERENEGDILMAASKVKPEHINFMAKYGRGLICLTVTKARCRQLRLPLMVIDTNRRQSTNFTMSIEASEGVTTGISAHDRAHTVQVAVASNASPEDLQQPGHIFPLMAQDGGVLVRAGHTEAGCDFTRLAGLEPAAVIVEVLNEDGSMARREDLMKFATHHSLKIGTIADLISYRLEHEQAVEAIKEIQIDNQYGSFRLICYEDHIHKRIHFALIKGEVKPNESTLVRVHLQDVFTDILDVESKMLGLSFDKAMKFFTDKDSGVLVLLGYHQEPREILAKLNMIANNNLRDSSDVASDELRTYGIGAQILRHIGVRRMTVVSSPKNMAAISGFGLEIDGYIGIE
jgi:3,4-dihydroxy 2-butanone 4-phosphate synthase / GTP cyclohydrolase II